MLYGPTRATMSGDVLAMKMACSGGDRGADIERVLPRGNTHTHTMY